MSDPNGAAHPPIKVWLIIDGTVLHPFDSIWNPRWGYSIWLDSAHTPVLYDSRAGVYEDAEPHSFPLDCKWVKPSSWEAYKHTPNHTVEPKR